MNKAMTRRKKLFSRILGLLMSFLLVFNSLTVPLVLAAEGEQELPADLLAEEPTQEAASSNEAQNESLLPETQEAESQAEVETTANVQVDCLPGQTATPDDPCRPPEIETECERILCLGHDNSAEVVNEATSSAATGDNEILRASGDALIDTGGATAGATLKNEVNTNVAILEKTEETGGTHQNFEENLGGQVEGDGSLVVVNENEATVSGQVDTLADTGENQANENVGHAAIDTGDALAYANLLNFLNTNIVGSNFEIAFLNLIEGHEGEVDFNQLWQEMIQNEEWEAFNLANEDEDDSFFLANNNQSTLENQVEVTASSGGNQADQNQGQVLVNTGDATALANVVNFVNLNLVGSEFLLVAANVFGSFLGDLILPRPETFMGGEVSVVQPRLEGLSTISQNRAEVEDLVTAAAETGRNETSQNQGESLIKTGSAISQANAFSLINTNILLNNWFFLVINHLGSWQGEILGWSAPGTVEESSAGEPTIFQLGNDRSGEKEVLEAKQGLGGGIFNQNQAQVRNEIKVGAVTGQNQASGNGNGAEITTGRAMALANLFNFININIVGGRWFLGLVNVLGDWQGDVVFAYPDVIVSLSNGSGQALVGERTQYTVNYQNQGYDSANEVALTLQLPEGISYLGDSSGLAPKISGQTRSWFLDQLEAGQGGSFAIQVEIDPGFSFEEPQLSFWPRIVPQARAAENEREKKVVALASIGTTDPESDLDNNTASAATIVYSSYLLEPVEKPEDEGSDQPQPILEISAWNNVGEYVFPGDVITFEITVKNIGGGPAYDVYLVQGLFNGIPLEGFGAARFEVGTLEPGKGGKLSFGLSLANNGFLPEGDYHTIGQAFGYSFNGYEVVSNEARTDFQIKLKELSDQLRAEAKEEDGEILGAWCPDCKQKEELLPYILLFLLSSLWLVEKSRKLKTPRMVTRRGSSKVEE